MKSRISIICCFLCLYIWGCRAQNISFHHLTTDNGLSHNSVISIYQDERGFMWFGTRNGVSLYNGKDFKIYQKEKNNPNSILYNDIYHITGDKKGHVYIMTNRGISAYDMEKGLFTPIIKKNIRAEFFSEHLYAATSSQIFRYDGEKFDLYHQLPHKGCSIQRLYVHNDSVLIGTSKGLYILSPQQELTHPIEEGSISDIIRDSYGCYWITTNSGHGVYCMQGERSTNFLCKTDDPSTISSNYTHRCCEDKQGNIWIGTFEGLNKYDRQTGKFTRYLKEENSRSLSNSSIWGLYCDLQGTVWVGTYSGGINYFNPQKQIYREYQASPKEKEGLSSPIVKRMTEDNEGNLWICTEKGGLNKYDPKTMTYQWFANKNMPDKLAKGNVRAIYYDSIQKVVWTGVHLEGLYKLDLKTGHSVNYKYEAGKKGAIPSNQIEDILPYQGRLILATDNGIGLFDPKTGTCESLFHDKDMSYNTSSTLGLTLDHSGVLWIVNNNKGACAYHLDTGKLSVYKNKSANKQSLSSNSINSIYEDSRNRLWFCTNENGLDLYRRETDDFENFDINRNGLASNIIYNICELSPDRLLVTTDKGFSILDLPQKRFTNYDKLPLSCINENALFKNSRGEIFIGGTTGIISFFEKDLEETPRSYRIYPFRLVVNGEEINVNGEDGILAKDITYTPPITLKANQNLFSIEYITTDYIPFNQDKIVYRLEGFSNTWNNLEQNVITYTNLNPGKYTLVVKAKDADERLVPPSRLQIEILPPFYRTVWAYLLYLTCIAGIAYYLVRTYYRRIQLQESLKYEQKHAEDIERLNQAKLRFFTNISHEFRTPLTLIIGQMEMLLQMRSFAPGIYNKILKAYKSSLQLRELITELLDFRKQEQGYMTIKVSEHNIVDFVYEHYLFFQEYAAQRCITFNFEKSSDYINVWYDARQMQKVINNLISNAFKHTKAGGTISISIRKRNHEVLIEVTDNGSGISAKDIDNIFTRFYQTEQQDTRLPIGTGIGLSLSKGIVELHHGSIEVASEPGEGATFCIRLQTGNEHFAPEQISETPETFSSDTSSSVRLQPPLWPEREVAQNDVRLKEGKYKILIVEDNDALQEMLTQVFEEFYTVVTATNGKEGLEKVRTESPNIVLSDIIMPEMSGTELCQAIKTNFETCHIPVVLLTAKTTVEHNLEGLRLGADDYITKPFNINILLARCNNLVNNRIILQEKFSKLPQESAQMLTDNVMDKKFMDRVMEIIGKEMDNGEFNVDMLAVQMNISRTKLFSKLKAITGQTPADFIMTIRLKRAAFLLRNNMELNIAEISDMVGFNVPKYFSKCFKERYHVTPQTYRKGKENDRENEEAEAPATDDAD